MFKILDSYYAKADLKLVADNVTQLNTEERTQLLRIHEDFEDLFAGNLGDWETDPVDLELNPGSKLFTIKYYTVPIINNKYLSQRS